MKSLLSLPTGRVARRVILLVWVVAMFLTLAFNLPGKFADAEDNESSSFLPGDAESTLALQETEQLTDGEQAGIVIAYRREGGLTEADQERISADVELLNAEVEGTSEPFAVAETSEDGSATLVLSSITATGEAEDILDPVQAIRDRVSDPGGGLEVKVTGAAGFSADAIEIFEQINGTLIGAAFLLVFVLLILIYRSPVLLWIPLIAVGLAELATRAIGFGHADG